MQEFIRKLRAGFDKMFAIIKDEQQVFRAQVIGNNILQRQPHLRADIQHGRDGLQNESRVGQRSELHEPDSIAEIRKHLCAKLQR